MKKINSFIVFTIAARGREFHFHREYLLENYLRLVQKNPNLFFCIVVGHPSYNSVDTDLPSIKALYNIFTRIRKKTNSALFFGIENINTNVVRQIIIKFEQIIPFILHGDKRLFFPENLMFPLAVYSPITYPFSDDEAIVYLLAYLCRRKETQKALAGKGYFLFPPINWKDLIPEVQLIFYKSFHNTVLTQHNYNAKIKTFIQNGVQLIIGYPALPDHFSKLVKQFKIETVLKSSN